MEAIGELVVAFVQLIMLCIESALHLIGMVMEMIFHAVVAAIEWVLRGSGISPPTRLIRMCIVVFLCLLMAIPCGLLYWWHADHVQRVAATEQTVDRLAEAYYQQTKAPDAQFQDGPLAELDGWDQPLQLDTEKSLLGWWIVVRSNGPDGRPETDDDVKAIRQNWNNLEQVGGELAQRGTNKVKEKIKGLLAGEPKEDPPTEEEMVAEDVPQDAEPEQQESQFKLPSLKFRWGKSDEKPEEN